MIFFVRLVILWSSVLFFATSAFSDCSTDGTFKEKHEITVCKQIASPSEPNKNYLCTEKYYLLRENKWEYKGQGQSYQSTDVTGYIECFT